MKRVLISYDVETVPDTDLAIKLHPSLKTREDAELYITDHLSNDRGFPKIMMHKIVTMSIMVWTRDDGITLHSLKGDESTIIEKFAELLETFGGASKAQLIDFNGNRFDSQVLVQRALYHCCDIGSFWDSDGDNKWNNYISRYHSARCDILDLVTLYVPSQTASMTLDQLAVLCDLPNKIGVGGGNVLQFYKEGKIEEISQYCDIDVLITFLIFIRLSVTQGESHRMCKNIVLDVVEYLESRSDHPHLHQFLDEWEHDNWI